MQALRKDSRLRETALWCLAPLLILVLYWPGWMAWFQKDDFAWLGLRDLVHSWHDLGWALFTPLAQGTIRTLSERLFYLSFTQLFGLQALPFRLWVLLTAFVTVSVLSKVCSKLTGSRVAGFWAAILWTVNSANASVFAWTAIYNELLSSLTLLTALWLLILYSETGRPRYLVAQWLVYLAGFLVLELNVVYPALALMYALCRARRITRSTIPLFLPAAAYTALHLAVAPLHTSGPYRMYWNASMASTLWIYWKSSLGTVRLIYAGIYPSHFRSFLAAALMAGLLGFLLWTLCKREWLTLFFASWFVIVLLPLLPLRDHISDYYLTIPVLGLSMWGGWALVSAWRSGPLAKLAAAFVLVIYLCVNIPIARLSCQSLSESSWRIHRVLTRLIDLTARQPQKTILLTGVNHDLFWDAFWHRPLHLFIPNPVYLVRDTEEKLIPEIPPELVPQFFLTGAEARQAIAEDRALLFDVSGYEVCQLPGASLP